MSALAVLGGGRGDSEGRQEQRRGCATQDMCLDLANLREFRGLPRWLSGRESTCSVGEARDKRSVAGSGRSTRGGNGNLLQDPCLENSADKGAWWATVYGVAESRTRLRD